MVTLAPLPHAPRPARAELRDRAARIRLVLTDCDGVLTDGGVFYSSEGESLKRFSVRDGMGVERLRAAGIETAIVTRETSPIVARRAEKLRLPHVFEGVQDKAEHLDAVRRATRRDLEDLAYIGDDVNDAGVMTDLARHGLTAAPADAMPAVRRLAHFVCPSRGGFGAFRDFAEWILALREGT